MDLVYYGNHGRLEYDFVVAPETDPRKVKLAFQGADKIEINPAGELVLHLASGELRMHKPVIYQEVQGARKSIEGGYVLNKAQEVGFQVATYDAARPLIIDPVLVYSTYLGGNGLDQGFGIAVDQRGQAYVTGFTGSTDFPTKNSMQSALDGQNAFVVQLTADGSALRYSTYLGGNGGDEGSDIAVDQSGQVYVTGLTNSSDFPTVNALQPTFGGVNDAFVAKLTADGTALRYSTYLGGSNSDNGVGIAVDQKGQAYVTGNAGSTIFPTHNALQPVFGGGSVDAFVAKLNRQGSGLVYSTYLGGSGVGMFKNVQIRGIAVDKKGQAYVTGSTGSTDFPTKNALQPILLGNNNAFVAQFTADGSALRYSTYLGGNGGDEGSDIAVDQWGQAFVTGTTGSTDFPIRNALQPTFGGVDDAFVAKFTADGTALRYSTYLGGSGNDFGMSIAVDQQGHAYLTGIASSNDFPIRNALQPAFSGGDDAFVAQFTADGSALRYSTYLGGGTGADQGRSIAVDKQGQAHVTGNTNSTDFPTMKALQPAYGGGFIDAFVYKIGSINMPCESDGKCKDDHVNNSKN